MLQSKGHYVSSASVSGVDPLSYAQRTLPGAPEDEGAQFGKYCLSLICPSIKQFKRARISADAAWW